MNIDALLGAWEEPDIDVSVRNAVTISSILQFRQSLKFLGGNFMFSIAFGDVGSRECMIASSQEVYRRLLLKSPDPNILKFDVLALAATQSDETLNQDKLKDMVRLLRPDREGDLSLLDFVKSCDSVYKEARLLRATVKNSEKIDKAVEGIINAIFYVILVCITLNLVGVNPFTMFLSFSSIILAFAFMVGSAASKMFEGFLFILIRRPYGIGDRINISDPQTDTNLNGSPGKFPKALRWKVHGCESVLIIVCRLDRQGYYALSHRCGLRLHERKSYIV